MRILRTMPSFAALAIMLAMFIFGALRHEHFASPVTLSNLFAEYAFVGIAAIGMTFVIVSGGIDLSVGAMIAFTSILVATLVGAGVHPLAAAAIAMSIGALCGAIMGGIIHAFALPPFIVTLAGMFAIRGLGFVVHEQSMSIRHGFYTWAMREATISIAGLSIPLRTTIFLAALLAGIAIMRWTVFGRNVRAIGGNARSARLMGVPIAATTIGVYALSGFTAALAGFVFTLYKHSGDPASVVGLELDVIAAVVIGGTLLSGGVGSVAGTLIGVLILGLIRTLIDFEGTLDAAWTSIATGILLLAFVAMQRGLGTLATRRNDLPRRTRRSRRRAGNGTADERR